MGELGLPPPPPGYSGRMPAVEEAGELVSVGPDHLGREAWLAPGAAAAWQAMQAAAAADGIELILVSSFRSVARQAELLAAKLAKGIGLEDALMVSAYPGFSEHHSGNAVDIGTSGARHLEEEFELTPAFDWLVNRAGSFGFTMTYPRDNRFGIAYEPWHWCMIEP